MEKTPDKKNEPTQEAQDPGRRRLLKALAAGGVVTAASMVPGKWSSPVLKSGVLPAHAQVTAGPFTIVAAFVDLDFGDGGAEFRYNGAAFDNGVALGANVQLRGELDAGTAVNPVNIEPTGLNGIADFVQTVLGGNISWPVTATVTFVDQATYGNASDTVVFNVPNGTPT